MSIIMRSLSSQSDILSMAALAQRFPESHFHVYDLPYRFSSESLDDPENTCLWFDGDQMVAWAAMQFPWWAVDYVCHPQYEADLHPHILAWANDRARSLLDTPSRRTCWFVSVFSGQDERIRDLETAGFNSQADVGEDSWSKVLMRREGQLPPKTFAPPPGYVVRPLAGPDEVSAYVDLHQSVFESKAMTTTWRQRTLQHPAYRPDLDLVVQAPDGRLAAFCICWLSEDGESGQVEPLGCQKDFRRFALGRVALAAGLHRMRDLGIEQIFVETDNYRNTAFRLYESFDFQVIQDVLIYRKDYA